MNQTTLAFALAASLTAMSSGVTAFAQNDLTANQDKDFYQTACQGSQAEIQMARLALSKSHNHDVRLVARKMIHDHTKLIQNMKPVGAKLGATTPNGLSAEDQAEMTKLEALSGNEFNREYVRFMVEDHHKDVQQFQAEEDKTTDPVVKKNVALAGRVIEQHARIVDQLAKNNSIQTSGL